MSGPDPGHERMSLTFLVAAGLVGSNSTCRTVASAAVVDFGSLRTLDLEISR
jgi:hypothetical protein